MISIDVPTAANVNAMPIQPATKKLTHAFMLILVFRGHYHSFVGAGSGALQVGSLSSKILPG